MKRYRVQVEIVLYEVDEEGVMEMVTPNDVPLRVRSAAAEIAAAVTNATFQVGGDLSLVAGLDSGPEGSTKDRRKGE